MNVKEFHTIIKRFLLRLRLRLARDGWTVTLVQDSFGRRVRCQKKGYSYIFHVIRDAQDAKYVLDTLFPQLGIDPSKHKEVVADLEKLVGSTPKTDVSQETERSH